MEHITLAAEKRSTTGKGPAREARRNGKVPAICYGLTKEPLSLLIQPKELLTRLKAPGGRNAVVHLAVDGEATPRLVFLKDLQVHPLKRTLLHVDFLEVTENTPLVVNVPVRLTGRAAGVVAGGQLDQILREITIRACPFKVPVEIVLDVTPLLGGQRVMIDELPMPEGVEPVFRTNSPVVVVKSTRDEDRPEEKEAGEAAPEAAAPAAAAATGAGK